MFNLHLALFARNENSAIDNTVKHYPPSYARTLHVPRKSGMYRYVFRYVLHNDMIA